MGDSDSDSDFDAWRDPETARAAAVAETLASGELVDLPPNELEEALFWVRFEAGAAAAQLVLQHILDGCNRRLALSPAVPFAALRDRLLREEFAP